MPSHYGIHPTTNETPGRGTPGQGVTARESRARARQVSKTFYDTCLPTLARRVELYDGHICGGSAGRELTLGIKRGTGGGGGPTPC